MISSETYYVFKRDTCVITRQKVNCSLSIMSLFTHSRNEIFHELPTACVMLSNVNKCSKGKIDQQYTNKDDYL